MLARPLVVGRYAIYDKIASGGMASVHFGRLTASVGFVRTVAVKRLHPHLMEDAEFLKTMLDEARLAARISHPNVVPTIDVVATEADLLVVMEYVRGESLARLLRALAAVGERLPLPVASAIAVGALHGLHAAHEATSDQGTPLGIVHRDVSPQNILVGIDGVPRIIDFGVAKAAGRLQTTREGVVKGKIPYMAPEQLGGHPVTARADVYAMAVVLWEMIAGRKLFQGDVNTVVGQVLAGAHIPPSRHAPNLPEGLDGLVMKGLQIDPESRFASARDMAEALVRIVPPSWPSEVGEWVQQGAKESLDRRGALLTEIESDSGSPIQQGQGAGEGAREDVRTVVSNVAQAPPAQRSGSRSRTVRVGLAAAVGAIVAVGGAATLIHRTDRQTPDRAASSPEAHGTITAATPADPAPTTPVSETAVPSQMALPSSASVVASTSPTAATSAPPRRSSRPTSTASRAHAPASPSAARNCNPNFYYDSAGQMRFKPECFQ